MEHLYGIIKGDTNDDILRMMTLSIEGEFIIVRTPTHTIDFANTKSKDNKQNIEHFVTESAVYKNLQWKNNSCWMDCVLVNILTYRTSLSIKIIRNMQQHTTNEHIQGFITILTVLLTNTDNEQVSIMDHINILHKYCENIDSVKNLQNIKTRLHYNDYKLNSVSSASNFLILLNTMFNLSINTYSIQYISNEKNISFIKKFFDKVNEIKISPGEIIIDIHSYIEIKSDIIHDIANDNSVNEKLKVITINTIRYRLTSAIVNYPGHYVSIIYESLYNDYFLINKLSKTTINKATKYDWQHAILLFYYPETQIISDNIITTASMSMVGGSNFAKYNLTKNKYAQLMLL